MVTGWEYLAGLLVGFFVLVIWFRLSYIVGKRTKNKGLAKLSDFKRTKMYESHERFVAHEWAPVSPVLIVSNPFPSASSPSAYVSYPDVETPRTAIDAIHGGLSHGHVPQTIEVYTAWKAYAAPLPFLYANLPYARLPYPYREFVALAAKADRRSIFATIFLTIGTLVLCFLIGWMVTLSPLATWFPIPIDYGTGCLFANLCIVAVAVTFAVLSAGDSDLGYPPIEGLEQKIPHVAIPEPTVAGLIPWPDARLVASWQVVTCAECRGNGRILEPAHNELRTKSDPNANDGMGGDTTENVYVGDAWHTCQSCRGRGEFSYSQQTLSDMVATINRQIASYNVMLPRIVRGVQERNRAMLWCATQLSRWLET